MRSLGTEYGVTISFTVKPKQKKWEESIHSSATKIANYYIRDERG